MHFAASTIIKLLGYFHFFFHSYSSSSSYWLSKLQVIFLKTWIWTRIRIRIEKIWYHFWLIITPLLQTNSGLMFLFGGFLHDELANHLDSLIDRSVLSVKIQHVATARSKHGHGIHYLDSIWLKIWDHFWLATTSGSIPLFFSFFFSFLFTFMFIFSLYPRFKK